MNYLWTILSCIGILAVAFGGGEVLPVMINSCQQALELTFSFVCVYVVWLGFFNVLKATGIMNFLSRLLSPVIDKVYGKVNQEAKEYLLLNLSGNLLGLGNASTPSAVKAVSILEKDTKGKCSFATTMLFVLNATSLQLLPTTVIGMRATFGSANPADIIAPTLVSTCISTVFGALLVHCFVKT